MPEKTVDNEPINPEFTYVETGVRVRIPSDRWKASGVREGDFLGSTSVTRSLNSPERILAALKAPDGTKLLIVRDNKRMEITLGERMNVTL